MKKIPSQPRQFAKPEGALNPSIYKLKSERSMKTIYEKQA